jgi:preprotein translocase subunit SecA
MAGRGTDILLGGNPDFVARQELVKKNMARAISVAEGAINPSAAPGMMRFYYQGQEYETSLENWEKISRAHFDAAKDEHEAVVAAGGLHILGTERHESRRIDNQLRGRAGRQGDPGASRFYLSLEDDLMRIFAREWVSTLLQKMGMEEGMPIESRMISKRIEGAQRAVESQNFEARKHLLEYDDVMNKQREAVYGLRRQLLEGLDQKELIVEDYVPNLLSDMLDEHAGEKVHPDQWDIKGLREKLVALFGFDMSAEGVDTSQMTRHELGETIFEKLKDKYGAKEQLIGDQAMRFHERMIMLSVMDGLWKDHLLNMDHLKEGIGLRGYGQQDPLVAYKKESFEMFEEMMERFQEDTVRFLFQMKIVGPDGRPVEVPARPRHAIPAAPAVASADGAGGNGHLLPATAPLAIPTRAPQTTIDELEREFERKKKRELEHARMAGASDGGGGTVTQRRVGEKVGRNDPCPCGSGKKYKKCHGANEG